MDELFKKQQEALLKLANNKFGRDFLSIPQELPGVIKLTPESYHYSIGVNKYQAVIRSYPFYAKKLWFAINANEVLEKSNLQSLLHYTGIKESGYPVMFFTNVSLSVSAGNGDCRHSSAVWATVRDAASSTSVNQGTGNNVGVGFSGGSYSIDRMQMPFVTSSLGPGAVAQVDATGTRFRLYTNSLNNDTDNHSLVLTGSTQASVTALVVADYSALTKDAPTEYASRIDITGIAAGGYNNFPLTGAGALYVNPNGNTKFAVRFSGDVDSSTPTGPNGINVSYLDSANDPLLEVVYFKTGGCVFTE